MKEFKNIKFFELPSSFEDDVLEKIKRIKRRRKRAKILALPFIFIAILTFFSLILFDFNSEKDRIKETSLSTTVKYEEKFPADIYLEVIPLKDFEKENKYLIEFVSEKEEKIYAF